MSNFIIMEGVDGCGKTTQINLLTTYLDDKLEGEVVPTREPGGSPLGETDREFIMQKHKDLDDISKAYLMMLARRDHMKNLILPVLAEGGTIVTDRFIDSTNIYQTLSGEVARHQVKTAFNNLCSPLDPLLSPTAIIVLSIDYDEYTRRMKGRGDTNGFDPVSRKQFDDVATAYKRYQYYNAEKYHYINGAGSPEDVHGRIGKALKPLIST